MTISAVALPPLPLSGGCQCGQLRYRITGVPVVFYLCHCRECQHQSSSAFGESLRVRTTDIATDGRMKENLRSAESGPRPGGWFCPDCGTRVIHGAFEESEVNVKAGTLDDTGWLVPAGHMWTRSKQRFVAIGADEIAYEGNPDTLDALCARWREMLEKGGFAKM